MSVPLFHPPGHAQYDFGEALVVIGGVEQKAHCFVLDMPHSDGCFVKASLRDPGLSHMRTELFGRMLTKCVGRGSADEGALGGDL